MSDNKFIEKIQLAEVDSSKKYLIMVKMDDSNYPEPTYFERAGKEMMGAMVRLGCESENISIIFGFAMEIASITTDESKGK